METDKIRITLGDWMWNASVVGFINIIGEENISYVSKDTVEFSKNVLNEFENKYFNYLIETYKETLSWYKIVDFKNTITYFENNEFSNFNLKSLKQLNKYIKDTIKYYIKSASYKSVYELIDSKIDILEKEKEINTIKEPKNDGEFQNKKDDIILEVKKSFDKISEIIDYCNTVRGKKYLAGKNVIYNVIKNSWDGICFLNRQTKEKDMYIDYKKYFVDPAMEYIDSDKKKYKFSCITCNKSIKDLNNDLSFLNETGFDVGRKSSHVWNFTNDIAICPVCKLIYSCIPAGMVYVYDRGIYINANFSIKKALNINNNIKTDILVKNKKLSNQSIYRALINSINEKVNENVKYELADIQVIRFENGSYRFNILARKTIETINKSESELNHIINAGFKEAKINYNIYELVVKRIFNNQNLYTLIHKTILYKLTNDESCYYNMSHVESLLYINKKLLGGMGYMQNVDKERDIIKESKSSGYHLREEYKSKEADNKLPGISYRLLNALKTDNKNMFMDVTLNCYLYVRKEVPRVFIDALKDDDAFKTIGYAFVAGLIDEKKSKDSQNA
ncbi:type I-B CRISPR-associated protein Cas8b1/Cst1 [Clostridium sp. JN-9]|uniref:type I-B CRISPR-associated protein Cas8b1/Cst1 n=1 Tax=Clostridium sp. JN-9 TaxID=2507159 RepID=UPI000FFE219B|nr:type I-B CRISPR-associated protein Cas8b1/Cst1 [Clostridium sp. JN-9]QAT39139.1 type I-B CRISPR-associated protein Cas8b1/Cst1 [Clostridium sp. JN-9]